jgi:peptide subunit release factor 1 (eRF1)
MNRLAKLIEQLAIADLRLIQKDLEAGNVDRLIRKRIEELDVKKTCPTCGTEMGASDQKYAIEFGPQGLRQKAYFDELDCLDYFMRKLHAEAERQATTQPRAANRGQGHA